MGKPVAHYHKHTKTQTCAFKKSILSQKVNNYRTININNARTQITRNITYLGLTIDSKFKWTNTAKKLTNQMKNSLRFISFIRGIRNIGCYPPTLKLLYTAYTRSLVTHTSIIFPSLRKIFKEKISRIKTSTLRRIYRPPRYYTNSYMKTSTWHPSWNTSTTSINDSCKNPTHGYFYTTSSLSPQKHKVTHFLKNYFTHNRIQNLRIKITISGSLSFSPLQPNRK